MYYPTHLLYTKDHEWIRLDGEYAYIGISDFAQKELGDIVFLDIPSMNKVLEPEAVFGTVEAVKTVSDLFMPVAGKVIEVNSVLEKSPELVNKDPYGSWIIKAHVKLPLDTTHLLSAEQYTNLVQ
ncbi:glycine cleavage system protein GcvH [Chitinophaga ginsengisegetis]|uniref:glycine cleavage system protein GcvH n=1 Tax=Chitinophaga ginsengisegetis TaxID=393003 RepID=UPI0034241E57